MSIHEIGVDTVIHISERPWSEYTEADYTLEQWHRACLVHQHIGPPTSKSQCKLPVKTPNGALNRNGVHAAAAALAGARSPLKASAEQKAKAASALRRLYGLLDETPPDSLAAHTNLLVEDVLKHYGTKGMKWGVRKQQYGGPKGLEKFPKDTASGVLNATKKMEKAYGFKIDEVVPLDKRSERRKYLAYVSVSNKGSNVINLTDRSDLKTFLSQKEKEGWFVPSGNHSVEANITHESSHAMLHSINMEGLGFVGRLKSKEPIATMRDSAWNKAIAQGLKDGDIKKSNVPIVGALRYPVPAAQMAKKLSKYAESSLFIEEYEAEMFTSYHWSPNPPKFVDTFMNDIHASMGKKVQPFSGREVKVKNA